MKILVVAEIEDKAKIQEFIETEGTYFFLNDEEVIEDFISKQEQ